MKDIKIINLENRARELMKSFEQHLDQGHDEYAKTLLAKYEQVKAELKTLKIEKQT